MSRKNERSTAPLDHSGRSASDYTGTESEDNFSDAPHRGSLQREGGTLRRPQDASQSRRIDPARRIPREAPPSDDERYNLSLRRSADTAYRQQDTQRYRPVETARIDRSGRSIDDEDAQHYHPHEVTVKHHERRPVDSRRKPTAEASGLDQDIRARQQDPDYSTSRTAASSDKDRRAGVSQGYDSPREAGDVRNPDDPLKGFSLTAKVFLDKNVVTDTFLYQSAAWLKQNPQFLRDQNSSDWRSRGRSALRLGDSVLARKLIQQALLIELAQEQRVDGLLRFLKQEPAYRSFMKTSYTTFLLYLNEAEEEGLLRGKRQDMLVPWVRFVYKAWGEDLRKTSSFPPDSQSAVWAESARSENSLSGWNPNATVPSVPRPASGREGGPRKSREELPTNTRGYRGTTTERSSKAYLTHPVIDNNAVPMPIRGSKPRALTGDTQPDRPMQRDYFPAADDSSTLATSLEDPLQTKYRSGSTKNLHATRNTEAVDSSSDNYDEDEYKDDDKTYRKTKPVPKILSSGDQPLKGRPREDEKTLIASAMKDSQASSKQYHKEENREDRRPSAAARVVRDSRGQRHNEQFREDEREIRTVAARDDRERRGQRVVDSDDRVVPTMSTSEDSDRQDSRSGGATRVDYYMVERSRNTNTNTRRDGIERKVIQSALEPPRQVRERQRGRGSADESDDNNKHKIRVQARREFNQVGPRGMDVQLDELEREPTRPAAEMPRRPRERQEQRQDEDEDEDEDIFEDAPSRIPDDTPREYVYAPGTAPPGSNPRRPPRPQTSSSRRPDTNTGLISSSATDRQRQLSARESDAQGPEPANPIQWLSVPLIRFLQPPLQNYKECAKYCEDNPKIYEEDIRPCQKVALELLRQGRSKAAEIVIERYLMLREAQNYPERAAEWMKRLPFVQVKQTELRQKCAVVLEDLEKRLEASPPSSSSTAAPARRSSTNVTTRRSTTQRTTTQDTERQLREATRYRSAQ